MELITLLMYVAGLCTGVLLGYRYKCGAVRSLAQFREETREEFNDMTTRYTETCDTYQTMVLKDIEDEMKKKGAAMCHPATINLVDKLYEYAAVHLGRPVTMEEANLIEAIFHHGQAGSPNTSPVINCVGSDDDN